MTTETHVSPEALAAGLDHIKASPKDGAPLDAIVRRPGVERREVVPEGQLEPAHGLVGDGWIQRGSSKTPDRRSHPDLQLTIMNSRLLALVAGAPGAWHIPGDQLFADLDISVANLPAGTRLSVGSAVIEITDQPHTGCAKFKARFGADALAFVNTAEGRELRLRGVYARIIQGGSIRIGDRLRKMPSA